MGLFGQRQVVGQGGGVLLVHVDGDLVEPGDEGVLRPVDQKLGQQNEDAIWRQIPEAV